MWKARDPVALWKKREKERIKKEWRMDEGRKGEGKEREKQNVQYEFYTSIIVSVMDLKSN